METMVLSCSVCNGTGSIEIHKKISECEFKRGRATCGNCMGKGYKNYAVFTVDEARAILKHCGLSTES